MERVHYAVRFPDPSTHLFELEGRFPPAVHAGGAAVLELPVWTPGSYLVREFARHVQDVRALDEAGRPLALERLDKRSWRVAAPAGGALVVRWRVYARDLTVRTSYLDEELAFFNGANLFLTSGAVRGAPVELVVEAPAGREVVCALPPAGGPGHRFAAADYDQLCDSPVLCAACPVETFTAGGKPHVLAVWGRGNFDRATLVRDLSRIVETEAALFGGLPYERYAFLVLLTDKGRGGLEHGSSCTLLYPRNAFRPRKSYDDFLQLAAHELFHLWNVKRIRPAALTPYDYGREQYTRLLWAFEGITSYYDTLVPLRAGLYDADRYLQLMAERASDVARTEGRSVMSLADASLCAWVKYYRPDENTANSSVSYYVQGEVLAMLLDVLLRRETSNARSLDDVMRLLWERHGKTGVPVPEDGVEAIAVELGGAKVRELFDRHVRGTGELPFEEVLRAAGLVVGRRPREGERDQGGTPPKEKEKAGASWLGAALREGDRPVVAAIRRGSPAERAGIAPEDELVALDGERLDGSLQARLEERPPGTRARLHLFRRGLLREVEVTLGARPADTLWFTRDPAATPAQKQLLDTWLSATSPARA